MSAEERAGPDGQEGGEAEHGEHGERRDGSERRRGRERRGGGVAATPALSDVADFLRLHAPFDALSAADVELVAGSAEIEFHLAGTTIFAEGAERVEAVRVIRSGAVEIIHADAVLDLLGVGEMFGHGSMLSGLPDRLHRPRPRGHAVLPDRRRGRAARAGAARERGLRRPLAADLARRRGRGALRRGRPVRRRRARSGAPARRHR